ncbi:uncharacterized protein PpBr36_09871 [Pyricularia pennisetigena]|uniref:uncharacterized protein n=1 Tax=Pyricularia pennisetigena TaxID=1578925 RepID=UPI0011523F4E|nr:uncharacterized protein PpBr36_09871 [Pyricularia pennisetigena]TLS22248.1 hypothetical protein PpBr36_09871 [Pyricularia pennisetigena]
MSTHVPAALDQGTGYGIVLGLGALFAFGMIFVTFVLKRYNAELQTSEMFNTAGRTVKSGLVGSAVVSSWTWAATLLQSTGVCYRYGVSGPFWYASGATVQIILFATLAIELKRRAPNAHTFLEVIKARFGTAAHITFMVFGLVTNILVSLMLIVGGSATVNALTGMHTIAAIYLLPVGVVAYTMVGGLKATILTDWVHTFILLVIIIIFALTTYATSEDLGSPSAVYDLLVEAASRHPVDGNKDGSYLTMQSREGAIFFVINIVGNFGTVFLDNGYYNKAIAASPVHALPGYILGGLSWFAIPWLTATTMGLAAIALESSPRFPTFPNRMSDGEVSEGLVLPYAAVALMGKGGAVATLLITFMAVTSATSSELIAVSSIFTYDFYRTYFNPGASGKRLIWISHCIVVGYAAFIATFSVGLWYAGISMGYLYVMMGVIISAAVLPAALTLTWSGLNKWAATLSPICGLVAAIAAWLATAKRECGVLDVKCTGSNNPMLAGNVVALLAPVVLIPIFTLVFGMLMIPRLNSVAFLVLWPMPMYGSGYIFSKPFFTGWVRQTNTLLHASDVAIGIIWIFCSLGAVGLFPIYEGRTTLVNTFRFMISDLGGKPRHRRFKEQQAGSPSGGSTLGEKGQDSKDGKNGSVQVTSS